MLRISFYDHTMPRIWEILHPIPINIHFSHLKNNAFVTKRINYKSTQNDYIYGPKNALFTFSPSYDCRFDWTIISNVKHWSVDTGAMVENFPTSSSLWNHDFAWNSLFWSSYTATHFFSHFSTRDPNYQSQKFGESIKKNIYQYSKGWITR